MNAPVKILVADDDEDSRALLRSHLSSLDVIVDEAVDGAELLWSLGERGPYNLVVTDVHMPRPDGRHVLAMARSLALKTPFLVISADATLSEPVAAFREASFLAKPVSKSQLFAAMRELLGSACVVDGSTPPMEEEDE